MGGLPLLQDPDRVAEGIAHAHIGPVEMVGRLLGEVGNATLKERGVTDFTQEPTDHFYGTDMGAATLRQPDPDPPAGKGRPKGERLTNLMKRST